MNREGNASVEALKSIYPNVRLVGSVRTEDGEPIDPCVIWTPTIRIVADIFSSVHGAMPQVLLNSSPLPNAGADYSGEGALLIFAGLPTFLIHLGETTNYLLSLCGPGKEIPIDFLKNAEFPVACKMELDNLSEQFVDSERSKWITFRPPGISFTNDKIYHFLLCIVILHEVGHLENNYKYFNNWERMMKMTKVHLIEFLSSSNWIVDDYSPGEDVVESWCKEAVADQLALSIMWHSKKLKEQLGLINLSFGIIYGILELFEWLSPPQEHLTHPTARMRRDLFNYIRAKELNMNDIEYYTQQNGPGLICGCLFDNYINRKFG